MMNIVRLGNYVKIKTGKLDANAANENGKYPFFTCSVEPLSINTYSYDCECVLIAGNGDLNVKYYNGKFDAYQRTYIVESLNKEVLTVPYLYRFMDKYIEKLREQSIGGVIKYIKLGNLTEANINLPSCDEQNKIVENLAYVDDLISKTKEQLAALDVIVKSRFIEMFGDPVKNTLGWPIKTLGDISSLITNGNTPKGGSQNYVADGILFLRSQNVWRNRIDLEDVAYITKEIHDSLKKSSLHNRDILITKTGRVNTENSSLGRAALFVGEDNSANINGHVYLVRLKNGVIPEFVLSILIGEEYRRYIRKVCVGGIDKRQINLDQVEDFPIILPPVQMQQRFVDFVAQVDKSKLAVQQSLNELETLKKSLMQQYFG